LENIIYNMKKKTRIVELVISDDSQELTIDAISLVSSPAIEEDFVFFGKEKNNLTFAKVDEEKRMLISPALIPNKQIFRYDPQTDSDYYVYFSKETVAQAAALYLKHNNHHKATYEHSDRVSGVLTVESWIKEGEQDKSNLYGFKGLPIGTWFVKMKIENDELWSKIKDGSVRGLSIEGFFIDRMETMSKAITDEQIRTAYKELQAEGKVKVELGLIDDGIKLGVKLKKFTKVLLDYKKELEGEVSEYNKISRSILAKSKKAESLFDEGDKDWLKLLKITGDVKTAVKELGVKQPKELDLLEKVLNDYDSIKGKGVKGLGQVLKQIK
tara:strand:+ start:727 stop:1707 length:981 start_codon:yes stop_codon:yes gene_type:complete